MFCFYNSWESQKKFGFLTFLGGIEMEQWAKIGWCQSFTVFFNIYGRILKNIWINGNIHTKWVNHVFITPGIYAFIYSLSEFINVKFQNNNCGEFVFRKIIIYRVFISIDMFFLKALH